MKALSFALFAALLFSGCATVDEPGPLPSANRVDLDRFIGKWYVLAATPGLFDREAFNATETISRAAKGFDLVYTYNTGAPDGEVTTSAYKAKVDNPGINTDWDITYAWPFSRDARVLYLEPDYSVAVMGSPDRKRVTILSRSRSISSPAFSDIILFLQDAGYDVGQIRRIPHN
jgi:apolipoprotein D and lipocalin family protein